MTPVRCTGPVLALVTLLSTSPAVAQTPVQPQGQPAAKPAAPPAQKDRYARIRRVSLANDGKLWVGFGGQVRERVEAWNNFNFGALPPASTLKSGDAFALTRLMVSADMHAGSRARLFAQGKSSFSSRRDLVGGRRPTDVNELDVHQLYAELRLTSGAVTPSARSLTVAGGRFEMAYGKGRLVNTLDWANTARSFDGARATYATSTSTITAFYTHPVLGRLYEADRRDSSTRFFGVYGTRRGRVGTDLYWMAQRRDSGVFSWNGTVGRENRHTLGTRLWGPNSPGSAIDLEAEAAVQFGDVGGNAVRASMLATQAGYTFRQSGRTPRVYVGFDYASGDEAPGGDVGTFNQLNPKLHAFLGFADIVAGQNVVDVSTGASARLWRALTGAVDYHVLRRASAADAYYAKPGGVARPPAFGASKSIGSNLDLTFRWPIDRHSLILSGYSHVFPGAMIRQGGAAAGADKPITFTYLMIQHTL